MPCHRRVRLGARPLQLVLRCSRLITVHRQPEGTGDRWWSQAFTGQRAQAAAWAQLAGFADGITAHSFGGLHETLRQAMQIQTAAR